MRVGHLLRAIAIVLLLFASTLIVAPPAAGDGRLAFSTPVLVDGTDASGEPGIKVDPLGTIYVNSLSILHDTVHVSADGGATFAPLHATNAVFGGGDDALAVDRFGGLYLAGQYSLLGRGCQSLSTSLDRGATWITTLAPCREGADGALGRPTDRPWIAVYRPNVTSIPTILMVHHAPCCDGPHWAVKSVDGGVTFQIAGQVTSQGRFPGNLIIDEPRARAYAFYSCGSGTCVARSDDLGDSWTERTIASSFGPGLHRVVGAADTAGNLYAVWAAGSSASTILMATSVDGGNSWSSPRPVSSGGGTAIMPWIAAGDPGKVVVAWYQTDVSGNPDEASDMQQFGNVALWNVKVAQSLDALSPTPTWEGTTVTPKPHHRGVLCTGGVWCNTTGRNRNLLDFFEITLDAQGYAHLVYATDLNHPTGRTPRLYVTVNAYAKQVGGASLYG